MTAKLFLPSFVVRAVSLSAAVFLAAGLIFQLAAPGAAGLLLTAAGGGLAIFALLAANAENARLAAEAREAAASSPESRASE